MEFIDHLKMWFLKYRYLLTELAINDLLKITKPFFPSVSTDYRTLLKTNRSYEIKECTPGNYCHVGVKKMISRILCDVPNLSEKDTLITLPVWVNFDGLPLSRSSTSQLWPFLMSINSNAISNKAPFLVGVYHGYYVLWKPF